VVGLACHEVGITVGYKWKDVRAAIFDTSTAKIRRMFTDKHVDTHVGLHKLDEALGGDIGNQPCGKRYGSPIELQLKMLFCGKFPTEFQRSIITGPDYGEW
jgi:hypothetical protein